jgi:hypothetical protein
VLACRYFINKLVVSFVWGKIIQRTFPNNNSKTKQALETLSTGQKKIPAADGCCGTVQGECSLPGGIEDSCWWRV